MTVQSPPLAAAMSPPHGSPSSTATNRRLADTDVRAIFESLHHHKPPPPNLPFAIVRVGLTGLKLSPPSHEFEGTFTSQ